MRYVDAVLSKERKPSFEALSDDIKQRKDKTFFKPTGTQVYVGSQGSGKTISAVRHLVKLKNTYPNSIIVSNLVLNGLKPIRLPNDLTTKPEGGAKWIKSLIKYMQAPDDPAKGQKIKRSTHYIHFTTSGELAALLVGVNNGFEGVVYIIDEIHTYFNALDSKNIPMYVFAEISQQRKQRKLIIGTSQLFLRMAKPLREQCQSIIVCKTRWGIITSQTAYDGETIEQDYDGSLSGTVLRRGYFWQTRKLRSMFDTYQKVSSGLEEYSHLQKPSK